MFFFACVVVIVIQIVGQHNNKSYLRAMKICSNTTKIYKGLDFFSTLFGYNPRFKRTYKLDV